MESVESEGMKGNDYLLNALLFSGVESVDLWLQRNAAHGVNDMPYQCLFPLSLINLFGGKNAFFVELKIYTWLIDSSSQRVHIPGFLHRMEFYFRF